MIYFIFCDLTNYSEHNKKEGFSCPMPWEGVDTISGQDKPAVIIGQRLKLNEQNQLEPQWH